MPRLLSTLRSLHNTINRKSIYAVVAIVAVYLLAFKVAQPDTNLRGSIGVIALSLLVVLPAAAVVLAVLGLREIRMSRKANRVGTTVQRYWPAIAALLFAFSFIVPLAFSGVARWRYNAALGASSRPSTWTRFTSPSGDFTVLLPEVAAETKQTVQHAEGPTTLRSVAAVAGPGAGYSVMVGEAPDDGENVTVRLDRLGADFVQRSKGKLLAQSVVSAGSVVGREIRIASAEHSLRARLFVVNRHVYQVLVIRPPAADEDVLDERFLDSFTLP